MFSGCASRVYIEETQKNIASKPVRKQLELMIFWGIQAGK